MPKNYLIEIRNMSDEPIQVRPVVDPLAEGCRVVARPFPPEVLRPGEQLILTGYEPGVSFSIAPLVEPERHR